MVSIISLGGGCATKDLHEDQSVEEMGAELLIQDDRSLKEQQKLAANEEAVQSKRAAESASRPVSIKASNLISKLTLGTSNEGRPIEYFRIDPPGVSAANADGGVILIFAGIHGNEPTTTVVAEKLVELLTAEPGLLNGVKSSLVIIPAMNPDGLERKRRTNARGVDLNRNFPAQNWKPTPRGMAWTGPSALSEPESTLLHGFVNEQKPKRILSIHSIARGRHGVNFDGPGLEIAQVMARENGYRVLETMGYPTPGSFGSWAGVDLQIPTITLELISAQPGVGAWEDNKKAILAFIQSE